MRTARFRYIFQKTILYKYQSALRVFIKKSLSLRDDLSKEVITFNIGKTFHPAVTLQQWSNPHYSPRR